MTDAEEVEAAIIATDQDYGDAADQGIAAVVRRMGEELRAIRSLFPQEEGDLVELVREAVCARSSRTQVPEAIAPYSTHGHVSLDGLPELLGFPTPCVIVGSFLGVEFLIDELTVYHTDGTRPLSWQREREVKDARLAEAEESYLKLCEDYERQLRRARELERRLTAARELIDWLSGAAILNGTEQVAFGEKLAALNVPMEEEL